MTHREVEMIAAGFYYGADQNPNLGPFWDALQELGYSHAIPSFVNASAANSLSTPYVSRLLAIVQQGSWGLVDRIEASCKHLATFQVFFEP